MWKKKGRNGRGEKNGWKERGVKEKAGRPGRRRKIRGRKEWEGEEGMGGGGRNGRGRKEWDEQEWEGEEGRGRGTQQGK